MKQIRLSILFLFFIPISNCGGDETGKVIDVDVEEYVRLLKRNDYQGTLPAFTYKNIPALLEYVQETQIITDFPHNPISSFYEPECKLGIYVLWTIESIRAVAIDRKYVSGGFPSLNPMLGYREMDGSIPIDDDLSHAVAAAAYQDWWELNKHLSFDEFKEIDPLADTDYMWR